MSTATYAVSDTVTLLRRNLKNQLRYPTTVIAIVGIPVLVLLLFVYVFGGALGTAVTGMPNGRQHYVDYILPGLIVMTAATGSLGAATSTSVDMTEGIIARFRTMAIFRPSILIARVISSVIQTLASMALVFGVALLMGFSPTAGFVDWIAAIGLLALASFALTWHHRNPPRPAHGHAHRQQRHRRPRLVPRHRCHRILLGHEGLRPRPHPLITPSWAGPGGTASSPLPRAPVSAQEPGAA